jgi:hypothetical protein
MSPPSAAPTTRIPPPKRVRIDESSNTEQTITVVESTRKTQPPRQLAIASLQGHCATLQLKIADIVARLGAGIIKSLSTLHNKNLQLERMKKDIEFVPRSAQIAFKLTSVKSVVDQPEFIKLEEETETLVLEMRKQLRNKILAVTAIETKQLAVATRIEFCKSIRIVTQAFLVEGNNEDDVDGTVYRVAKSLGISLLGTYDLSLTAFELLYQETHALESFPPDDVQHITPTEIADDDLDSEFGLTGTKVVDDEGNIRDKTPAEVTADRATVDAFTNQAQSNGTYSFDIANVKRSILHVFSRCWKDYVMQWDKNEASKRLAKFQTETFAEKATVEAMEIVEGEPSADKKELLGLIQKEAAKQTQKMEKEMEKLQKKFATLSKQSSSGKNNGQANNNGTQKNFPPGRKTGASANKKTGQKSATAKAGKGKRKPTPGQGQGTSKDTTGKKPNKNGKKTKPGDKTRTAARSKSPQQRAGR